MKASSDRPIVIWLFLGVFLILVMVSIGGITRLTHSGLSMVEWSFIGSIPPLSEDSWQETFELYQQYPEYKELNSDFTLADFKSIFWWEYIHRQFGRFIGLVFIFPFLFFLFKKKLSKRLTQQLLIVLALGAFQALLGWFMVKSGLVKEPRVSHYRLAAHLITAFLTCCYIFWVALDLIYKENPPRFHFPKVAGSARWFFALVVVQVIYGAFVAGLRAGLVHNTFPLLDGELLPDAVTALDPLLVNFIEGKSGVQYIHRILAFLTLGWVCWLWIKTRKQELDQSQRFAMNGLLAAVLVQFTLGVITLLLHVPIIMGVLHQSGALFLLLISVMLMHRFRAKTIDSN